MKKVILTLVALLSMTAMQAQNNDNNERKAPKKPTPEEMTDRMAKMLKLDDGQKAKVLELNKKFEGTLNGPGMRGPRPHKGEDMGEGAKPDAQTGATQQRPERPQLTDEQRAEMEKFRTQREAYNTQLKTILTEEQFNKYQEMQRMGRRHHFGHGRGPGHHQGPRPEKAPQE